MSHDSELSLVVPVYNEEDAIPVFLAAVIPVIERIGPDTEIVFIVDGSHDRTREVLKAKQAKDARVKIVGPSRTFGK